MKTQINFSKITLEKFNSLSNLDKLEFYQYLFENKITFNSFFGFKLKNSHILDTFKFYGTDLFESKFNNLYRNNIDEYELLTDKSLDTLLSQKSVIDILIVWHNFKENIIADLIYGEQVFNVAIWNFLPKTVRTEIAQYVLDFWVHKKETTHKDCKFIYDFIREEKLKANTIDNAFAEIEDMFHGCYVD
jgi:hypothetical protein